MNDDPGRPPERRRPSDEAEREPLFGRERTPLQRAIGLFYLALFIVGVVIVLAVIGVIDDERPGPDECAPGYSKCLEPGAADYDCEGEGDGPEHVTGPFRVTGDDRFDLDPDGNGFGCE